MPPDAVNYLYNDIVVVEGADENHEGQPIKSFTAYENVDENIELAKAFVRDRKLQAISRGDQIPNLQVGRVCVDLSTPHPHRAWVDFNFQKSQLGNSPTPNPKSRGGLVPA